MNEKSSSLETFKGEAAEKPKGFPALLEAYKPQIAAALPKHLNADRMARIALTCFRTTPKLSECDPINIFACVIQAAQLGLEPGLNGRAYILPYFNKRKGCMEAQFIPGWKGLVELANRSGRAWVHTGVIYKDQKYNFNDGSSRSLDVLNETDCDDDADITHVYAVGRIKGMEDWPYIELWRIGKVEKHRDRYNKVGERHYSYENMEMYARKVVLLQVLKYLPSTPELEAAIILNDHGEIGSQSLTLKDAIEGTFTPVPDESPAPASPAQDTEQGVASRPNEQVRGGLEYTSAHADHFAMADDLVKSKDFKGARDLLPKLHPKDRAIIEPRLPKEAK